MLYSVSIHNNMPIAINPAVAGLIDARIFVGTFDADAGHFISRKNYRRLE